MERPDQAGALEKKMTEPETEKIMLSLLERVRILEETQIAGKAVWDIQTNSIVERLADSVEKASILLDRLTSPESMLLLEKIERSSPTLLHMLEIIEIADKTGAFQSFAELGGAVRALQVIGVDTLIERVATQAEKTSEILDRMEHLPLEELTEALSFMKEVGALETVPEIATAIVALRRILTDSLIEKVMSLLETAISWQGNVYNVLKQVSLSPSGSPGGIMGAIRLLSNPETQETLAFVLEGFRQVKVAMKP
jgi:uncharacterized protein YjgD (DUF1641 family)